MYITLGETTINWVYLPIEKIKIHDIERAIYDANNMKCPNMKKNAWKKVYLMTDQYKKQETFEIKIK